MSYSCRGCGYVQESRWKGKCPRCSIRWAAMPKTSSNGEQRVTAASIAQAPTYLPTGEHGFDHVLGGGLVESQVYLITGKRGLGKSSLLTKIAKAYARDNRRVLYASGEESLADMGATIERMDAKTDYMDIMAGEEACDIDAVVERAEDLKAKLAVLDSLQVTTASDVEGDEGSAAQCKAVTNVLTAWCKRSKACAIMVCHQNSSGDMAGGETVQHLGDAILRFDPWYDDDDSDDDDSDDDTLLRVLSIDGKNRKGPINHKAFYEMTEAGLLRPVKKKSKLVLVP